MRLEAPVSRSKSAGPQQRLPLSSTFAAAAGLGPKRRAPRTYPFSIRLTRLERQALERVAGTTPLGAYVRRRLLESQHRTGSGRKPKADGAALGKILAILGGTGLSAGLATLAEGARQGIIQLTPAHISQIEAACADIRAIRSMLLNALGLTTECRS